MGGQRVTLNALVMPSSRAVVDYVATHPLAVGYVSSAAADDLVRIVPVEGQAPVEADVRSGAYYLARTVYLATRDPFSPAVRGFLEFVDSAEGQKIVEERLTGLP